MKVIWHPDLKRDELEFISLAKPWQVFCAIEPITHGDTLVECLPATVAQLTRAHDLGYVMGILEGHIPNGFGKIGGQSRAQRSQILAANGAMITAVRTALDGDGTEPVFAPVSGFHHAHYADAKGYCTFNGLMIAIANARLHQQVPQVLIIDGDAHEGDGTDNIIDKLWLRDSVTNLTRLGRHTWYQEIEMMLSRFPWDLVLYQAGADAHEDDPYGEGYLNDDDWEARDRLVFQFCAKHRVPLVFNLAGGYGPRTVELHRRTAKAARMFYKSKAYERAHLDGIQVP